MGEQKLTKETIGDKERHSVGDVQQHREEQGDGLSTANATL